MYKLHLILKYLRKRRIAWVSLLAVMLCTTMVLVVISVMGGWLRMFEQSFHGLTGDIIVDAHSLTGFSHYQDMIDRMEKLESVEAAVPTIRTFALINIANRKSVCSLGSGQTTSAGADDRVSRIRLPRRHQLTCSRYITARTYPSGSEWRKESQRAHVLAKADWTRSCAAC